MVRPLCLEQLYDRTDVLKTSTALHSYNVYLYLFCSPCFGLVLVWSRGANLLCSPFLARLGLMLIDANKTAKLHSHWWGSSSMSSNTAFMHSIQYQYHTVGKFCNIIQWWYHTNALIKYYIGIKYQIQMLFNYFINLQFTCSWIEGSINYSITFN